MHELPETSNAELELELLKNLSIQTSKTYHILSEFTDLVGIAYKINDHSKKIIQYSDISVRKHYPDNDKEVDPYMYVQPFRSYSMVDDTFHQDINMVTSLKAEIQSGREERLKRKALETRKNTKPERINPVALYKEGKRRTVRKEQRKRRRQPIVREGDFDLIVGYAQDNGLWSVSSRIDLLKYLHTDLEFAINQAEETIGVSHLFSQFILTLVALDLLNTFFPDRKEEWKNVRQKAVKSCKDFVEPLNEEQREALMEIERQIRQAVAAKFAE